MNKKYYASGEILPRLLSDAWADTNKMVRGTDGAIAHEIQMRRVIEAGIDAGVIRKRIYPTYAPCDQNILFEDCSFEWGEVRAWAKEHMQENWPFVPFWIDEPTPWSVPGVPASPESTAAWLDEDASMSASYWWGQSSITAQQAASLLCGFNPNSQTEIDFKNDYSGNTRPADYKKALNAFEALERATTANRTLKDWNEYAPVHKLTIHSWLGVWIEASGVMRAPLAVTTPQAAPAIEPVMLAATLFDTNAPEEWIIKSVELANEIGLKKWNGGERQITARQICNAVATELAKGVTKDPQKYHGSQGPRSAGAVRSVGLKGWKFIYPSGIDGINGTDEIT